MATDASRLIEVMTLQNSDLFHRKLQINCYHQKRSFQLKMRQKPFGRQAEGSAWTSWVSLQRSPRPSSWIQGCHPEGEGKSEGERGKREYEGREGRFLPLLK